MEFQNKNEKCDSMFNGSFIYKHIEKSQLIFALHCLNITGRNEIYLLLSWKNQENNNSEVDGPLNALFKDVQTSLVQKNTGNKRTHKRERKTKK